MRDLASPVAAFVRERCEIGTEKEVEVEALYGAYKTWCESNEHRKDSTQMFGRNLHAVAPGVQKVRPRAGTDTRCHVYKGLGLKRDGS
jgi:putative DNA primase/helicase